MSTETFAYLLQQCPYSRAMAKRLSREQKKWVRRGSPQYQELRAKYPSFPIVFVHGKWIGGYEDFVKKK